MQRKLTLLEDDLEKAEDRAEILNSQKNESDREAEDSKRLAVCGNIFHKTIIILFDDSCSELAKMQSIITTLEGKSLTMNC